MTNQELKQHVESALAWEPSVDCADIGVSAVDAVVTLRGNVASYAERVAAERAALHVYGVKAVANDLVVRLPSGTERTDTDIAHAVVTAFTWSTVVPQERVTATVTNGWVTLNGALDWQFQKDAAARAVRDLTGVRGVENHIVVTPHVDASEVKTKIEAAFKRSAQIDARRVRVAADNGKVILTGQVRSWAERQEAERAAWAAPGVVEVDDRLTVTP